MRAAMVKFSCLEADSSLGLSLAPPAVQAGGAFCELTGLGGTKVDPLTQLASLTTRFVATEANR
jgi:hypothetical protein